jgi:hypothetical protein
MKVKFVKEVEELGMRIPKAFRIKQYLHIAIATSANGNAGNNRQ